MRTGFLKGVAVGGIFSTAVLVAAAAMAGTGVGAVFNLGQSNSVNATTTLTGTSAKTLQLQNDGNGATLGLHVKSGQAPLITNSTTKATNLNADLLDGISSAGFIQGTGKVVHSQATQGDASPEANVLVLPTFGAVRASCGPSGFTLIWQNGTSPTNTQQFWYKVGATDHYSDVAASGDEVVFAANTSTAEIFTLAIGSGGHGATVTIAAHSSGLGGCQYTLVGIG